MILLKKKQALETYSTNFSLMKEVVHEGLRAIEIVMQIRVEISLLRVVLVLVLDLGLGRIDLLLGRAIMEDQRIDLTTASLLGLVTTTESQLQLRILGVVLEGTVGEDSVEETTIEAPLARITSEMRRWGQSSILSQGVAVMEVTLIPIPLQETTTPQLHMDPIALTMIDQASAAVLKMEGDSEVAITMLLQTLLQVLEALEQQTIGTTLL
jgi:hypothetical protein